MTYGMIECGSSNILALLEDGTFVSVDANSNSIAEELNT